jgi:hypothetical protein
MADPFGAPLAQMFSPLKSPFHALALAGLIGLAATFKQPLSDYGSGFMLLIVLFAFCLAPWFQPTYTQRVYGLSLIFGRSVGVIGGILALAILVTGSVAATGSPTASLSTDSPMFPFLWWVIVAHSAGMIALFFCRTLPSHEERRYNIGQFCLMQSTLLIFAVGMAVTLNEFAFSKPQEVVLYGLATLLKAPKQLVTILHIAPRSYVYALLTIWAAAGALNGLILAGLLEPGWVEDHGEGSS